MNGEDLTQKLLSYPGYSLLLISKKLGEAESKHLSDGFELGNYCLGNGISFYILTASETDEVKNYDNGLLFCSADETTLKTIVRANPGYILIKNGTIAGKWSWANVPEKEWFSAQISQSFVK
jgi:triosephosphate isomerase